MQILFWGSPKWNLTEANWAVLAGLRQANRAGLSTPYLFSVDAVCQGAHCPAEAQLSCTTGADAQQRCKSHSRAVTATCRCQMKHTRVLWTLQPRGLCQHWELLAAAGIKPPMPSDWHIGRAEETQPILLCISCYFCYIKLSFYFQCKGISPSPLLGLKQDSLWNFTLIPSQALRLKITFVNQCCFSGMTWCHII